MIIGFDAPDNFTQQAIARAGYVEYVNAVAYKEDEIQLAYGTGVLTDATPTQAQTSMTKIPKETISESNKGSGDNCQDTAAGEKAVGILDIYIVRDAEDWHGGVDKGDKHLGIFSGSDWEAIFIDTLNCTRWESYTGSGNFKEHYEHQRVKFQQSILEFPMLGRIYSMFEDVGYTPADVKRLRDECLTVQARATNPSALKALNKLIFVCDEALKVGRGLFLVSD